MAWYDEAIFYHIYPLGLTGAPKQNPYSAPGHRLNTLLPWLDHIKAIGCNAIYIGPLFESVGHGYETTDYRKLDSRLGTNEDLKTFVAKSHEKGIRVILDGVFNHVGRDFFAFKDLKEKREGSPYRDWFSGVNFYGNNEYNDGFSYNNWGGYNLLVKLNLRNPQVREYLFDSIRFWVSEFDIDGLRLDAADVLDFDFMRELRHVAGGLKPEFWLMGEVIHGDYTRWVNEGTLHSLTNYHLHKALFSGHNDHNYFEIAHTVKRLNDMGGLKLYNFVDNHDVERIYTKLNNKAHFAPVHILLYTLPGVPSIYYGSEFAVEGRKERHSDDSLRPALSLNNYSGALENNPHTKLIAALGRTRRAVKELSYGDYKELKLTNRQYAFSRSLNGRSVIVTVNNDDSDYTLTLPCSDCGEYVGAISGQRVSVVNNSICVNIKANFGDIWLPAAIAEDLCADNEDKAIVRNDVNPVSAENSSSGDTIKACAEDDTAACNDVTAAQAVTEPAAAAQTADPTVDADIKPSEKAPAETEQAVIPAESSDIPDSVRISEIYEKGKIAGLQEAVLALMEARGNVTEQMRRDVMENVYHDSLVTWVKSFR